MRLEGIFYIILFNFCLNAKSSKFGMSNLVDVQCFDICLLHRDTRTGAVIVRCSQPEVGWLGWRSTQDEVLLSAITAACKLNPGSASTVSNGKTGDIFISLGFCDI